MIRLVPICIAFCLATSLSAHAGVTVRSAPTVVRATQNTPTKPPTSQRSSTGGAKTGGISKGMNTEPTIAGAKSSGAAKAMGAESSLARAMAGVKSGGVAKERGADTIKPNPKSIAIDQQISSLEKRQNAAENTDRIALQNSKNRTRQMRDNVQKMMDMQRQMNSISR